MSAPDQHDQPSKPPPAPKENWAGPRVVLDLPRGNQIEIRLRAKVTIEEFEKIKRVYELSELSFVDDSGDNKPSGQN